MFNALNRFISRLDSDSPTQNTSNNAAFGFQVLRNTNLELSIEPWFDFIVGINGRLLVCFNRLSTRFYMLILSRITRTQDSSHKKSVTVLAAV